MLLETQGNVLDRNARYLEEKGLIEVDWQIGNTFGAQITAQGIGFLDTGEPTELAISSPLTIQEFNAPVGLVAGRDVNIQVSFNEVLNTVLPS